MTLGLQSVRRGKSLHTQTYETLRTSILTGEIMPGERLIETQLAERLNVSRTPLREALRQLQQESLITDDEGGLRVMMISVADAEQLYDCRMALEELAVMGTCEHASDAHLQGIHTLVQAAELAEGPGGDRRNSLHRLELDCQFHRSIAEGSGNRWLVHLLDQVFDKMALLRVQTTRHNPTVLEIRGEHRQIYEAIAQRNPEIATAAIRTHLIASKERVVQEVQSLHQHDIRTDLPTPLPSPFRKPIGYGGRDVS